MTDGELMDCLRPVAGSDLPALEFLFLNGCGTWSLCMALQQDCGIPVVLGWADAVVPEQQRLTMVRMEATAVGSGRGRAMG